LLVIIADDHMEILDIINALNQNYVQLSSHSLERAKKHNLEINEIYLSVIQGGEIIEYYPDAYPLPACLILGWCSNQAALHTVWGYNKETKYVKLITVYRPDPKRWIYGRIRI
jgi:hypothetical protein